MFNDNTPMKALTSKQRKFLRSEAHHLDPLILVGRHGLTDALVRATAEALDDHELIKVRFNEFKGEKREIVGEMTRRTGAELVGMVGHVATLYRQNPDPEKRRIDLPGE